jgi:hypothetical protein
LTAFEYRAEDALHDRVEYDKKTSGLINKLQRRFRASDKEALRTWRNLDPATRGFA